MAEIWNPFALAPIRPAFRMDGDAFVFCSGHVVGRVGFWPDPFIRLEGFPDGCRSALGYADFLKRSERNRTGWTVGEAATRGNGFVPSRLRREWLRVLAGRRPVTALDRWRREETAPDEPLTVTQTP